MPQSLQDNAPALLAAEPPGLGLESLPGLVQRSGKQPCSRSSFLKGIGNLPSSWPTIRAKTPRREIEIWNVASPSYRHAEPAADPPWAPPAGLPETGEDGVVKLDHFSICNSDRCARRCCGTPSLPPAPPDLAISTFNVRSSISWSLNYLTGNSGIERQRPGLMRGAVHSEPT